MQHVSLPIRDFHAPTFAELIPMLNRIDDKIAAGGLVYVPCWGGCGRTRAVVASWLVKQGWSAESALDRYAELSRDVCGRRCPEQPSQFELEETYAATVAVNA